MPPSAPAAPAAPAVPAAAPRSRAARTGAYLGRLGLLMAGLALFAFGEVWTYKAGLGLGPWTCLHLGLSGHLPVTPGQAAILTGVAVTGLAMALGARPGVGTICNMVFIGLFFDAFNAVLPDVAALGLVGQLVVDVLGIAVIGLGSGLYIKAALGAGPRDSLMLVLSRRTGRRVALVRAGVEFSALGIGFLLGGAVGIGTLIFAAGIGPAVEAGFRLLRVPAHH